MLENIKEIIKNKKEYDNIWKCYDACKAELRKESMTSQEWNNRIKEITNELNI